MAADVSKVALSTLRKRSQCSSSQNSRVPALKSLKESKAQAVYLKFSALREAVVSASSLFSSSGCLLMRCLRNEIVLSRNRTEAGCETVSGRGIVTRLLSAVSISGCTAADATSNCSFLVSRLSTLVKVTKLQTPVYRRSTEKRLIAAAASLRSS